MVVFCVSPLWRGCITQSLALFFLFFSLLSLRVSPLSFFSLLLIFLVLFALSLSVSLTRTRTLCLFDCARHSISSIYLYLGSFGLVFSLEPRLPACRTMAVAMAHEAAARARVAQELGRLGTAAADFADAAGESRQ